MIAWWRESRLSDLALGTDRGDDPSRKSGVLSTIIRRFRLLLGSQY